MKSRSLEAVGIRPPSQVSSFQSAPLLCIAITKRSKGSFYIIITLNVFPKICMRLSTIKPRQEKNSGCFLLCIFYSDSSLKINTRKAITINKNFETFFTSISEHQLKDNFPHSESDRSGPESAEGPGDESLIYSCFRNIYHRAQSVRKYSCRILQEWQTARLLHTGYLYIAQHMDHRQNFTWGVSLDKLAM